MGERHGSGGGGKCEMEGKGAGKEEESCAGGGWLLDEEGAAVVIGCAARVFLARLHVFF